MMWVIINFWSVETNLVLWLFCYQGYDLPWEDTSEYPNNMALALDVAIQASNGASDYGNKFGEPVVTGFARSFGMKMPDDERREWIKPIMFSGGIGMLDGDNILKLQPETGESVNSNQFILMDYSVSRA